MRKKIRWGILSTGKIARVFAQGLKYVKNTELVAVGSRSKETADAFAKEFKIPNAYSSYENLAKDPNIDVIYIATPHNLHAENSILCLNNGKSVLCEKPFTVNAKEAKQVVKLARKNKLFLMEAMWARFLPMSALIRKLLNEKVIGDIKMFAGDFGVKLTSDPISRILNPHLAGGALLDVGVYPVAYASMVFGKVPIQIDSSAYLGSTGVDEQSAMIFKYDKGELAILYCANQTDSPMEACIMGSEGYIRLEAPFWRAENAILIKGKRKKKYHISIKGNGYNYQAEEVNRCISEGKSESELLSLDESISIMETMDKIRAQWGLKYPMEK